jgi:hypothetical protein
LKAQPAGSDTPLLSSFVYYNSCVFNSFFFFLSSLFSLSLVDFNFTFLDFFLITTLQLQRHHNRPGLPDLVKDMDFELCKNEDGTLEVY